MKKRSGSLLKGELMNKGLSIIKKIRMSLIGKAFVPMPSYWALIPVKLEKKLSGNLENFNNREQSY